MTKRESAKVNFQSSKQSRLECKHMWAQACVLPGEQRKDTHLHPLFTWSLTNELVLASSSCSNRTDFNTQGSIYCLCASFLTRAYPHPQTSSFSWSSFFVFVCFVVISKGVISGWCASSANCVTSYALFCHVCVSVWPSSAEAEYYCIQLKWIADENCEKHLDPANWTAGQNLVN